MITKINPVTLTPSYVQPAVVATHARVAASTIRFGNGTSAYVELGMLDDDEFVNLQSGAATVAMTAEQYASWGTDDNYAVDCFIANLGLVKA